MKMAKTKERMQNKLKKNNAAKAGKSHMSKGTKADVSRVLEAVESLMKDK